MATWRLLDTGVRPIAENMALNKVILMALNRGWAPETVRFLEFDPPSALVGLHQALELEVDEDYCLEHGIQLNRRITGGGNLYLDDGNLGWEIYTSKDTPGIPHRLDDMYELLCESAVAGLKKLGVDARFRPKNDLEVGGRKIGGSGGTEIGDYILYHGTVLVDFDVDTMINCLRLPIKKLEDKQVQSFKERVITLKEILGYRPEMKTVKQAMTEGFSAVLGLNLEPSGLTPEEEQLLAEQLPIFQSEEWIRGGRTLPQNSKLQVVDYKAEGGLIRVSVLTDPGRGRIKYAFITGDFFAYPERSILDLEAWLKNTSTRTEIIRKRVEEFFEQNQVRIPGVGPQDFACALEQAVAASNAG